MARPVLTWSWDILPANSDVVTPLIITQLDGKELSVFFNHTQNQMFFEYDGDYGTIVKGDEDGSK